MVEEREACFGTGRRGPDYLGLVSLGILLLIVGVVFVAHPNLVSDFQWWIEQMGDKQDLIRPPGGLIASAVIFFGLLGISNFFKAGIRLWIDQPKRRAFGDVLSGIALALFAFLIHLYGNRTLTWQMVLAIEVIVCGLLIALYSVVRYVFLK